MPGRAAPGVALRWRHRPVRRCSVRRQAAPEHYEHRRSPARLELVVRLCIS